MRPAASELRSSDVRVNDSNGARFGSYGKRDGDVRAAGERFEERPLRAGQVLEAVGEDGPVRPGVELAGDEVGGVSPAQVPVPEPELLELGAIRRVEKREVAAQLVGLDEPRLELRERGAERIREAGEARGGAEPVQRRLRDRGADDQLALGVGRDREIRAAGAGDLARRGRRRSRSGPTAARRASPAARARCARRPTRAARSRSDLGRARPDSARGAAQPCPRSRAQQAASARGPRPSTHRRPTVRRL